MASYDFKPPTEGFTKQTLPIIPASTWLAPIPLEYRPVPKEYHDHDDLWDEHGRQCVPDEHAVNAIRVLLWYNRYLEVLPQPHEEPQRFLSRKFVECGNGINRVVSKADEDVRLKLEDMQCIARCMLEQVELDDRFFEDGIWALLNHDESSEKLKTREPLDPARPALLVRRSFQRAVELSLDSGFTNKLDASCSI